ncbi:hypothetical protein pipiens_004103 [Culex pipiens pipiens]|uniref:Uncharacterized protein n=1 Tax=Culex pipiens pipiens TaxID=38569 RepID=A0ABD1CNC3_CULPP
MRFIQFECVRQWYRRRDPIYQDIVSSLNRRIREECNQANFNKFKDTLRTLHDDRDTLWRITKALRKTTKYSPPLRKGTNIIASSSEKAKLLAASFASAHTNQMPDDPATVAEVNNSIDAIDRTPLADNHSCLVLVKPIIMQQLLSSMSRHESTFQALPEFPATANHSNWQSVHVRPVLAAGFPLRTLWSLSRPQIGRPAFRSAFAEL